MCARARVDNRAAVDIGYCIIERAERFGGGGVHAEAFKYPFSLSISLSLYTYIYVRATGGDGAFYKTAGTPLITRHAARAHTYSREPDESLVRLAMYAE